MQAFPRSEALIREIRDEFPSFKITSKSQSILQRSLGIVLTLITLGRQKEYRSRYHTVIGSTLFVPSSWWHRSDEERYIVLRHERVHLRQFRRYGLALMTFLYLVPFFPIGLAWCRARLEWEAYTETLRATAEVYGIAAIRNPQLQNYLVQQFVSGAYGWMWPFPTKIRAWVQEEILRIEQDFMTSPGSRQT